MEDLALSLRLAAELHRWADDFDATTPRGASMKNAGFVPSDWVERWWQLARQRQAEVGDRYLVGLRGLSDFHHGAWTWPS